MKISEWLKELLVAGIIGNLSGLFDGINDKVAQITDVVGMTPQQWNSGVFSMVKNLSEIVVTPIAGIILTAVACIELLSMMIERNNMRDFDLFEVFKWLMKTTFAVMIVSNTWTIVMGVFEATQSVVNRAAGVVVADTSIHLEEIIVNLEQRLMEMEVGPLFGLFIQSVLMQIISWLLTISMKRRAAPSPSSGSGFLRLRKVPSARGFGRSSRALPTTRCTVRLCAVRRQIGWLASTEHGCIPGSTEPNSMSGAS